MLEDVGRGGLTRMAPIKAWSGEPAAAPRFSEVCSRLAASLKPGSSWRARPNASAAAGVVALVLLQQPTAVGQERLQVARGHRLDRLALFGREFDTKPVNHAKHELFLQFEEVVQCAGARLEDPARRLAAPVQLVPRPCAVRRPPARCTSRPRAARPPASGPPEAPTRDQRSRSGRAPTHPAKLAAGRAPPRGSGGYSRGLP